jgi:hypothetical protein
MTPHIIELAIIATILTALWHVSRKVDNGLRFLKKEMEYMEKDLERHDQVLFPTYTVTSTSFSGLIEPGSITSTKEPSFKQKVRRETKRISKVK